MADNTMSADQFMAAGSGWGNGGYSNPGSLNSFDPGSQNSSQSWMNAATATNWQTPDSMQSGQNAVSAKPWYSNPTFASAVSGSVQGILGYLNLQEKQRGDRALQQDSQNFQTATINAAVNRASTMPVLQRVTRTNAR